MKREVWLFDFFKYSPVRFNKQLSGSNVFIKNNIKIYKLYKNVYGLVFVLSYFLT